MKPNRRRLAGLAAGAALLAAVTLSGCTSTGAEEGSPQGQADAQRDEMSKKWDANAPYPAAELGNPLDRKNLSQRLVRNNDPNRISYLYLISMTGEPYAYFVIKGKLTSTEASLMPTDAVIDACNSADYCPTVVQGGGDDGTYGQNENAVFGFTDTGVMITLSADNWVQTDQPMKLNVPDITPGRR